MKTITRISVLAMFVIFGTAFAQKKSVKHRSPGKSSVAKSNPQQSKIRFGAKTGGSFSFMNDTYRHKSSNNIGDDYENKGLFAYHGGLFANFPLTKNVTLQPELLFTKKGEAQRNLVTEVDYRMINNYLALPVMVQYHFTPNFYAEAGPEFSFLVSSLGTAKKINFKDTSTSYYQKFDIGLGIGAGYFIKPNVSTNFRFTKGFIGILNKDYISNPRPAKNMNLQLSLNYFFN